MMKKTTRLAYETATAQVNRAATAECIAFRRHRDATDDVRNQATADIVRDCSRRVRETYKIAETPAARKALEEAYSEICNYRDRYERAGIEIGDL